MLPPLGRGRFLEPVGRDGPAMTDWRRAIVIGRYRNGGCRGYWSSWLRYGALVAGDSVLDAVLFSGNRDECGENVLGKSFQLSRSRVFVQLSGQQIACRVVLSLYCGVVLNVYLNVRRDILLTNG